MTQKKSVADNFIVKGFNWIIDKFLDLSGFLGIILMIMLSIFVSVYMLARHFSFANIPGFFDFSKYVLVVFPFVTAAFTMRAEKHIAIDIISTKLSPKGQIVLRIMSTFIGGAFVVIFVRYLIKWLNNVYSRGNLTMGVVQIPQWILVAILTCGMILLAIQVLRNIIRDFHSLSTEKFEKGITKKDIVTYVVFIAAFAITIYLFKTGHDFIAAILMCLTLLFSGMPVFMALLGMGIIGLYFAVGAKGLIQIPITVYGELDSFELTCLPIFVFAGCVMGRGDMIKDVFKCIDGWIGGFTPSLLIATVLCGAIISALTGSSTAATAMLAATALPLLSERGFKRSLSCGLISATGTGSLIPPSTGYVIYCVLVEESISKMFIAAYVPAILMFGLFVLLIIGMNLLNKKGMFEGNIVRRRSADEIPTTKDKLLLTVKAIPTLLGPILMFITLYLGIFTATEAAAFLLVYAIFVTLVIKRTLTLRALYEACKEGAHTSALILCMVSMAFIFATVVSQMRIADLVMSYATTMGVGKVEVILFVFFIMLVMGMFMPGAPIKVITLPILYPVAMAVGIDPYWLGIFYQINCEFATFTPPFGMDFFILKATTGASYVEVLKGVIPFCCVYLVTLLLISVFPSIVTWLPNLMA